MSVSVSETIGKLLLEGYKMLADSCEVCCTVLMQDRRGRVICVQCESASMANSVQPDIRSTAKITNGSREMHDDSTVAPIRSGSAANFSNPNSGATLSVCEDMLTKEIQNATTTLQNLSQLQHDMQAKLMYVRYIRECAETIQAVKGINK